MDRTKIILTRIIVLMFLFFWAENTAAQNIFAEDFKKPLLKLPEVSFSDDDERIQNFLDADIKSKALTVQEEKDSEEQSSGFVSAAFGRFNTQLYDLKQSVNLKNFYYSAKLNVESTSGDRANTDVSLYKPSFILGIPFDFGNEVKFYLDYFDKTMGLPGKTDNVNLDASRRNSDLKLGCVLDYSLDRVKLKFKPYYEYSIFNDTAGRYDFKHKTAGSYFLADFDDISLDFDISEHRLLNYNHQVIMQSKIRLEEFDFNSTGKILLGMNLFAQENFGQRAAPFIEFIFQKDDSFMHKVTIKRNFMPVIFNQTYLADNYVEVNVNELRPARELSIEYQIDKYISSEWRANALVYLKQTKDFWFWSDGDGDGFYAPESMKKVDFSGIKLSTEYTWNESFSNFFSINIQNNRSQDPDYEFVPLIPKQKISAGLTYKSENNYKIDFFGDYFSRRYYYGNSRESSSGYFQVSSKITYEPKDYLTIFILIDNLLNDRYDVVKGYPNQSRSVMSGVMVKF